MCTFIENETEMIETIEKEVEEVEKYVFSPISNPPPLQLSQASGFLNLEMIVTLFGNPLNITSELLRKASFISSPFEDGFLCLAIH